MYVSAVYYSLIPFYPCAVYYSPIPFYACLYIIAVYFLCWCYIIAVYLNRNLLFLRLPASSAVLLFLHLCTARPSPPPLPCSYVMTLVNRIPFYARAVL